MNLSKSTWTFAGVPSSRDEAVVSPLELVRISNHLSLLPPSHSRCHLTLFHFLLIISVYNSSKNIRNLFVRIFLELNLQIEGPIVWLCEANISSVSIDRLNILTTYKEVISRLALSGMRSECFLCSLTKDFTKNSLTEEPHAPISLCFEFINLVRASSRKRFRRPRTNSLLFLTPGPLGSTNKLPKTLNFSVYVCEIHSVNALVNLIRSIRRSLSESEKEYWGSPRSLSYFVLLCITKFVTQIQFVKLWFTILPCKSTTTSGL